MNGFSVYANTQIPAHRRDQWEPLLRYTARGTVALEWLAADAQGNLGYRVTKPWSDGTTGITLPLLGHLSRPRKAALRLVAGRKCRLYYLSLTAKAHRTMAPPSAGGSQDHRGGC
jgi:hypothetical protein